MSTRQLVELGLGEAGIARLVSRGHLYRVHRGVYAVGHPALEVMGRIHGALLYGGDDAALSHTTAAWWWKLLPNQPTRIHLTVPGRRKSVGDVVVHHTRDLELTRHNNLPVTTTPRTLLDLAAMLPFAQLRRALAEADYRGLLDADGLTASLGRGRPGSAALRKALDNHLPDLAAARSPLEERFLVLCDEAEIPLPEINTKIGGLTVDALWRRQRIVIELDGGAAHGSVARMRLDRARDLELREAGYRVLRYSGEQVRNESTRLVAELRRALCLTPA